MDTHQFGIRNTIVNLAFSTTQIYFLQGFVKVFEALVRWMSGSTRSTDFPLVHQYKVAGWEHNEPILARGSGLH